MKNSFKLASVRSIAAGPKVATVNVRGHCRNCR